ncbi:MAG: ATP-binding protein [Acidimicrobiia bacterium]|jgi:predicted HTH transcriptional regulator|nr:ATP-binding protein [Bacteroidales bacterium]OQA85510.1 MAG: Divergent AAA domain protein [Bacteroidetes bacterium ADurb.Bin234]
MSNSLTLIENQQTEFKLSFQEKVIETLVAFANTSGGTVYIGESDKIIVNQNGEWKWISYSNFIPKQTT